MYHRVGEYAIESTEGDTLRKTYPYSIRKNDGPPVLVLYNPLVMRFQTGGDLRGELVEGGV